jgi:hypothetical protein
MTMAGICLLVGYLSNGRLGLTGLLCLLACPAAFVGCLLGAPEAWALFGLPLGWLLVACTRECPCCVQPKRK